MSLAKAILNEVNQVIQQILTANLNRLRGEIGNKIREKLYKSKTLIDLIGGRLRGELGIIAPASAIESIIGAIVEALELTFKVRSNLVMSISLLRKDFGEVLSLPRASYIAHPSNIFIPWLEWLLFAGSESVVQDFHYVLSPETQHISRTGEGLMFPSGSWRVPVEHMGTSENNFLVRALTDIQEDIAEIVGKILV